MRRTFGIKTCTLLLAALLVLQLGFSVPMAYAVTSEDVATVGEVDGSSEVGDAVADLDTVEPLDDSAMLPGNAEANEEVDLDAEESDDETLEPVSDLEADAEAEEDLVIDENTTEQEPIEVEVQSSDTSGSITKGALTVSGLNKAKELEIPYSTNGSGSSAWPTVEINDSVHGGGTLTMISSNSSIAEVDSYYKSRYVYGNDWYTPGITAKSLGIATITVTYTPNADGGATPSSDTVSFKVVCHPDHASGVTAKKASTTKVRVGWNAFAGASGYRVYRERYNYDAGEWQTKLLKTVSGVSVTSTDVVAPWGEYSNYIVLPYLQNSGTIYASDPGYYEGSYANYTLPYPATSKPTVKKASYNKVSVAWKQHAGVTGYKVYRTSTDQWGYAANDYKVVATIKGGASTSTTLEATWDTGYLYEVRPYLTTEGKTYVETPSLYDNYSTAYTLFSPNVCITSVKKASAKKLKVTWTADKGVTGFKVYRSTKENSGYSCVAKPTAGTTSYVAKATPGTIYYYKVVAVYGTTGNVTSKSFAQQIPLASGSSTKAKSVGISGLSKWYDARDVYTYVQGTNTYVAYLKGRTLTIVGYNKNRKRTYKKKVKLDKYEVWGGIYHGPDNNNYVVTGSPNYKESKTKVVIRVTKYSSAWKKGKIATIKGGVSNDFEGIYEPFAFSSIALDMQGSTLYLMTARTMFQTDDGLHHQSNIAFSINTKSMKAAQSNISYASHSFAQKVRFKDGTLYVADHGDAYPRAMALTWQVGYGTKQAQEVQSINTFNILGETGNNYTGASLDGMEISNSNVLLCGVSVPQNYAVKGVKGADWSLQRNLYVTVTKRSGGKNTVKWLTTYHPKKKVSVSDAKMVKLSDNRFGILYTVYNNGKSSLHYTVIDGNGKKIFTRTIKGASTRLDTQPCYVNGTITWASCDTNYKGKLYSIRAL